MDLIILLGGLGTRLKSISDGVPKSLMPVGEKVYLDILLDKLKLFKIDNIYLSLHYKPELFIKYISQKNLQKKLIPIIEPKPLGTGGAIKYVRDNSSLSDTFFVINGDTFSNINIDLMNKKFNQSNYDCMIGISLVDDCSRYGKIKFENDQLISFNEKSTDSNGWINNGFYIMQKNIFNGFEKIFSLEYDVFPKFINNNKVGVFQVLNDDFIDIGIPKYYKELCKRLP